MKKTILVASIAVALSGCASIMNGGSQNVSIRSTPSEAKVLIKDSTGAEVFSGATPASVTLQKGAGYFKKREYIVDISKDGFAKHTVRLNAAPSGWYIGGNILFGGLIGWLVVDPISGAMWTLSAENIDANLQATKVSSNDMSLQVALLQDISPTERAKLVALN